MSGKEFKEWDKIISEYIWQGPKPTIKYRTIQLPKGSGGLVLPCLKVILRWHSGQYSAKWKDIGKRLIEGLPMQVILCEPKPWLVSVKMKF